MNVKIKATGIACLLGEDYNRVYAALTKQLGKGADCLFTERIAGHEYLQWVLPGDGWTALAESDPLMADEVRRTLKQRQQNVMSRFGANVEMAQRVLTVPDDEYIYYKAADDGSIDIKLTAWGYRYPERVDGGNATGVIAPATQTENITIKLTYNGQPMPAKEFKLNDFKRYTDADGKMPVGDLPVGYRFDIEADGLKRHCIVTRGESLIELDCTVYADIDVTVRKDDAPAPDKTVSIEYDGTRQELTTDPLGHVSTRLPLSLTGAMCTVSVENKKQQQALRAALNAFDFILDPTPAVVTVDKEDDDKDDIKTDDDDKTDDVKTDDDIKTDDEKKEEEEVKTDDEKEEEVVKPEEAPRKSPWWVALLMLLALALLTALTYWLCKTMLFA